MANRQDALPALASLLFVVAYFGLSVARGAGWISLDWSLMPVIETAWMNFLLVVGFIFWMKARKISFVGVGLGTFPRSRSLPLLITGIIAVDALALGIATPGLEAIFGSEQRIARFDSIPGNLPLLLMLIPMSWAIAFSEEFFFRGFLLTTVAGLLGSSRAAWIAALLVQATGFGLVHAYQGPVLAIAIGIGGIVYGMAFVVLNKNIWPLFIAHGINNSAGLVLLYLS